MGAGQVWRSRALFLSWIKCRMSLLRYGANRSRLARPRGQGGWSEVKSEQQICCVRGLSCQENLHAADHAYRSGLVTPRWCAGGGDRKLLQPELDCRVFGWPGPTSYLATSRASLTCCASNAGAASARVATAFRRLIEKYAQHDEWREQLNGRATAAVIRIVAIR